MVGVRRYELLDVGKDRGGGALLHGQNILIKLRKQYVFYVNFNPKCPFATFTTMATRAYSAP